MNPEEYGNLANVEWNHWYYSGKRKIARHWIRKSGGLDLNSLLADCGAGTGAFAREMQDFCRVIAIDGYPESISILNARLGESHVLTGSCTDLPLETDSCDFATAMDVLEHIEDDYAALAELYRVVKPGGVVIITVPALMSLWSDWDVTLRHFRRYDRVGFFKLVSSRNFEILNLNYMNFWAFPAVWTLRRLRAITSATASRVEDKLPPSVINSALRGLFVWSSCQTMIRWPFGVGLLAVLRKS